MKFPLPLMEANPLNAFPSSPRLPKQFDCATIQKTWINCHNCGRHASSRKAVMRVEQKQADWVVTTTGVVVCFNGNCHEALGIG